MLAPTVLSVVRSSPVPHRSPTAVVRDRNEYELASDGSGFQIYGGSVIGFREWQSRALQDSTSTFLPVE